LHVARCAGEKACSIEERKPTEMFPAETETELER
jgi:hypothetical protein